MRAGGFGDVGNHGTLRDAATFSAIVLADEGLSRSPQTFGLPAAPVPPTAAALEAAYEAGIQVIVSRYGANVETNRHWQAMFSVYRGFHGHGYSGDPHNGDHDCPGPMFDWHRFAREVWDWWWWPFDIDVANLATAVPARPYSLATRDGNTPLKEYFWSTLPAVPQGLVRPGIHGASGSPQTFELPQNSRIYALANGELVAARFPAETGQVSLAFMLVRHEVFHQLDARPPARRHAHDAARVRESHRLQHPAHDRLLALHASRAADGDELRRRHRHQPGLAEPGARPQEGGGAGRPLPGDRRGQRRSRVAEWNDRPPSTVGRRPTLSEAWTADNAGLTAFLNTLSAGNLAVVPLDADATPIRILLGDYLAHAGVISRDQATGTTRRGVRVEVFSTDFSPAGRISTDFTLTDTSFTGGGWAPATATGNQAVRYRQRVGPHSERSGGARPAVCRRRRHEPGQLVADGAARDAERPLPHRCPARPARPGHPL